MSALITNNAVGALASGINAVVTSLTLSSGQGALFPTISDAADYFYVTLIDTSNNKEIVKVTSRTADAFDVIVRAQDGTTARAFTAGDRVELRTVAAVFDDLKTYIDTEIAANAFDPTDPYSSDLIRTGAAGTERFFRARTTTEDRWAWGASDTAESGTQVGSDFELQSFDDDGVYQSTPFWVKRSTGQVMHGSRKADALDAGTALLFMQQNAPTGWTKATTYNNHALRLVTGTSGGTAGGTTPFTTVFTARTIAEANLPAHTHGLSGVTVSTAADHTHTQHATTMYSSGTSAAQGTPSPDSLTSVFSSSTLKSTAAGGSHTHTLSGSLGNTGSGTAMDFDVSYVNIICATKDA